LIWCWPSKVLTCLICHNGCIRICQYAAEMSDLNSHVGGWPCSAMTIRNIVPKCCRLSSLMVELAWAMKLLRAWSWVLDVQALSTILMDITLNVQARLDCSSTKAEWDGLLSHHEQVDPITQNLASNNLLTNHTSVESRVWSWTLFQWVIRSERTTHCCIKELGPHPFSLVMLLVTTHTH